MKKLVIFTLSIIMFFFKSPVLANYEKVFYDFEIKSITGEIIDLKIFKINLYFWLIQQVFVVSPNNMKICKYYGKNIIKKA